ncbi:MAG: serine protease, partial [Clostridia bacterium]|nr:serine protease [Clostridia bacterium]
MKKLMILICGVAALLCAAFCGCGKQITAQDIYTQCIDNVVEVKAVTEGVGESFGTAEIISADGTLVTNAHVVTYTRLNAVNTFEEYFIRFSNEEDYRAVTLEKYDSEKDIAILKMSDVLVLNDFQPFKPIKLGNSESLKAGEEVYAVGNASNYGIGIFKG